MTEKIRERVDHYNNDLYHGTIGNVTRANKYRGRDPEVLKTLSLIHI